MGTLDAMLAQLGGIDINAIAGEVAIPVERAEAAIAALSVAHVQPGDTVKLAAASSAIPADKLEQIMRSIGGDAGLSRIAELMGYHRGKGAIWERLSDLTGNLGR